MATRAEQFRSNTQRTGRAKHKSTRKAKRALWSREKSHAATKATHAMEAGGSRESTRGSANRAKPDAAFNLTEELKKGAPQSRARKMRAKTKRVRGSRG
jgi:hypothetical protein